MRRAGPGGESNPALPKSNPSGRSGGQCILHALLHSSLQCVFVPHANSDTTHHYYCPFHVLRTLAAFDTRRFLASLSLLGSADFRWVPGLGSSRMPAACVASPSPFDLQPLHLDRNRIFSMFSCFPLFRPCPFPHPFPLSFHLGRHRLLIQRSDHPYRISSFVRFSFLGSKTATSS